MSARALGTRPSPLRTRLETLHDLIDGAKTLKQERGGNKGPVAEEAPTIQFAFATAVAIRDIAAGEPFTRDNVWVKRPGTGEIPAERFNDLLKKRARTFIASDTQISWGDTQ